MAERNWSVFIEHAVRRRGRIRHTVNRNLIRWAVNEHRRLRRDAFEQQWLHCSYPAIRMEPPAHDAVIERVIDGHQTHALVMRHVSVDDHSLATLPLLLPGVVQRLVETHASIHAGFLQPLKISDRILRVDQQGQRAGIRRDH